MCGLIKLALIQIGPAATDKNKNVNLCLNLVDQAAKEEPDFIIFPELFTTPYWPLGTTNYKYFEWAESIPGPTTTLFAKKAREYGCYIITPIFEKGSYEGEYYNSAALIGPSGDLIYGTLPDGTKIKCYRKNHLAKVAYKGVIIDEPFYFKPGPGLPVFQTEKSTVGILICRDRYFPEAWRVLALQGAKIVFVPVASCGLFAESFVRNMRTWSEENQLFAAGCNRCGEEEIEGKKARYFGLSCVCDPSGNLVAQAPEDEGPVILNAQIDLKEVDELRKGMGWYRDRRPEIYNLICKKV